MQPSIPPRSERVAGALYNSSKTNSEKSATLFSSLGTAGFFCGVVYPEIALQNTSCTFQFYALLDIVEVRGSI
jgi:hypothetical protein